jgi:thiamine-monophosphate kinase
LWETLSVASRELHILTRIRALLPGGGALVDDCGAIPSAPPGEVMLVTTDLMEEGIHFRTEWHPPELLGAKLLNVNLSDLDASGAAFLGFTLTLALPAELELGWLEAFLGGLAEAARAASIPVLGGDTVGRSKGVGLGITAFGSARRWLRRDGVVLGDRIYVDQPLGLSLKGLRKLQSGLRWDVAMPDPDISRHLDPRPMLGLGPRLADIREIHACMDLSDGLSRDLRMLANASGVALKVTPGLADDELFGGEDYARCFASSLEKEELESLLGIPLTTVAAAVEQGESPLLVYNGGSWIPLDDRSFDHFEHLPDRHGVP